MSAQGTADAPSLLQTIETDLKNEAVELITEAQRAILITAGSQIIQGFVAVMKASQTATAAS